MQLKKLGFISIILTTILSSGFCAEWSANWIWCDNEPSPRNFYLYVRKTIKITDEIKKATAFVSADSRYKLWINGEFVGRGPARCDPRYQYYDIYDLTEHLHPGKNAIASLVHHYGEGTFSYILGKGGFIFQAEIECVDGEKMKINSDESWKVKRAQTWKQDVPRTCLQLGFQEVYDANKVPEGWQCVDSDDSGWEKPLLIGIPPAGPWESMVERDIPFLREEKIFPEAVIEVGEVPEIFALEDTSRLAEQMDKEEHVKLREGKVENPQALLKPDENFTLLTCPSTGEGIYIVVDFGKEVTGYPRFKIEGSRDGIIDLGYSELLQEGRVNPTRGIETTSKVKYADRYVMKDGLQQWEASFGLKGFRYMQLIFRNCSEPIKIYWVGLNFCTYPVEFRGAFECSDKLLNRIWKVGRYTQQLCMHDAYEDCPWREQAQWWGDAQITHLTNYYTFGDTKLAAKGLRQIAQSQLPNGLLRPFYPSKYPLSLVPVHVDYCLIWVISLWNYYQYSGEANLLKELYPTMVRVMNWFEEYLDDNNLLNVGGSTGGYFYGQMTGRDRSNVPYMIFIDWARDLDRRGECTALNCFYYETLLDAARIARVADDKKMADKYESIAALVKDGVNARLWSEDQGIYVDCRIGGIQSGKISQQANALAVVYDIAPPERVQRILQYILEEEDVIRARPYFMHYVLGALFYFGKYAEALELIRTKWGNMLEQGASTWWETWDSIEKAGGKDFCQSLCHAWSATPTFQLSAEILGIKPTSPGFKEFRIMPKPADLQWAKGSVPSVKGDITVSWQIEQRTFKMEAEIPPGTIADIGIPVLEFAEPEITANGVVVWSRGEWVKTAENIEESWQTANYIWFKVKPGAYKFIELGGG